MRQVYSPIFANIKFCPFSAILPNLMIVKPFRYTKYVGTVKALNSGLSIVGRLSGVEYSKPCISYIVPDRKHTQ